MEIICKSTIQADKTSCAKSLFKSQFIFIFQAVSVPYIYSLHTIVYRIMIIQ